MASQALPSMLDRPVPLRLRHDLQIVRQQESRQLRWVLKDPLTREYFQLEDREYHLLCLLDGSRSLTQIKQSYEARFPFERLNTAKFHSLCLAVQREGLLVGYQEEPAVMVERRHELKQAHTRERLANPFALRFRGIDPAPLLDRLYPPLRWCFATPLVLTGCILAMGTFAFVLTRFDLFRAKLPEFQQFMTGSNLALLMLALLVTKVLHELAHGLACKHFGGECREMGAMLLVFTPCLYCDVSDAWLLNGRWRRIAISAAGMYVELILAAGCLTLWWFSRPGLLQLFLLNMVMVCTVATIVFNANPLLRFDGYYILSDALGVANLWARSRAVLMRLVQRFFLGVEADEPLSTSPPIAAALLLYAVASVCYRGLVVVGIAYLLIRVLQPLDLEVVGYGAIGFLLLGTVAPSFHGMKRLWTDPLKRRRMRKLRLFTSCLVIAVALLLLLLIPLPHSTQGRGEIRLANASTVYVTSPGILVESVAYGTQVQRGDVLVQLSNSNLQRQLERATGERTRQVKRVEALSTLRGIDPGVAAEIPTAVEILHDLEERIRQLRLEEQRLRIVAPQAGLFLPPKRISEETSEPYSLTWLQLPLSTEQQGRLVSAGESLGQVGDPTTVYAEMSVGVDQVGFVAVGQPVELRLWEAPHEVVLGKVAEISPARRATRGSEESPPVASGREKYDLRIELERSAAAATVGAPAEIRIATGSLSLASRIRRSVGRLFQLGR